MDHNQFFPLRSMTAFGSGVAETPGGRISIEIQSVNRRYLEINVNLPRPFARFEMEIRKALSSEITRGSLNVSVTWKKGGEKPVAVSPNIGIAKGLHEAWKQLCRELKLKQEFPIAPFLAQGVDLFIFEEESDLVGYQQGIFEALQGAIDELLSMKYREGIALTRDMEGRLLLLEEKIGYIEAHAPDATEKYRHKLTTRLHELFTSAADNEEKILREIAVFAEKIDISEEITRFKSHLHQLQRLLHAPLENKLEARGKTLDFLIQELNREVNTIGAKSADVGVSQAVIAIKGELEKIREQVQNIE